MSAPDSSPAPQAPDADAPAASAAESPEPQTETADESSQAPTPEALQAVIDSQTRQLRQLRGELGRLRKAAGETKAPSALTSDDAEALMELGEYRGRLSEEHRELVTSMRQDHGLQAAAILARALADRPAPSPLPVAGGASLPPPARAASAAPVDRPIAQLSDAEFLRLPREAQDRWLADSRRSGSR